MASNEQHLDITVPNSLAKQTGLSVAWINNNKFATLPMRNTMNKRQAQRNERGMSVDINLLKPTFVLDEPMVRMMVYECSRVFYTLQKRRYGLLGGQTQIIDFVAISHQYRSCLRHTMSRMNRLMATQPEKEVNKALIGILYGIECIWHLVEFLILDANATSGSVVSSLLEWVRFHFPIPERQATEMLQSGNRNLDTQENYWPAVKELILQGQTMVARTMLRLHSCSETHCFQTADQLLQSLPIYSVHDGLSVHKYKIQWQCWRDNVRMLIAAGNFGAEPHLEELLRLVTGDRATWREQMRESICWYQYLPAFLLYTDSSCRNYQLSQYANDWMMDYIAAASGTTGRPEFTFLDKLVLSVMDNNLPEVLLQLQHFPDNQWCAVHMTDLLFHAGMLEASPHGDRTQQDETLNPADACVSDGKLIRDALVYEFGCLLMSNESHWLLGMDYLEFSTTEGLGAREALLARVPIRDDEQGMKIVAVARKNKYPAVEMEISKVMTKRNLQTKQYGGALEWAIRSRDSQYVQGVADIFLEHYCNHGEELCQKLVANLGTKIFISSRLVFLKKYYDFRQLYRDLAFAKAAELLVNLMDSKITPSYFWPCLMADAIPLLEFKEPIIPSKETLIVLERLQMDLVPLLEQRQQQVSENLEKQYDKGRWADATDSTTPEPMEKDELALIPKFTSNLLNNCTEDLISLVRLACTRNLSRAYIIENSATD